MLRRFGDCELDTERFELRREGDPVAIEPRAMEILLTLLEESGRVVTKNELLDRVWGDRFVSESALTTQIKELRRALGDSGREQRILKTVHGRGYMFVADLDDLDTAALEPTPEAEPPDDRSNPVVAVLPLIDLSAASGREHVAEGLTHDIVAALSRHRWLRVLTRAATGGLAGEPDAITRLQTEYDVNYVVEGTVRFDERRMRVTATLTDASSGACRWTERFDRTFDDLFDVLDEIVDMIAAIVEPEVGQAERERVSSSSHANLAAWDQFHLGLAHFYRFTAEDNLEAQRLLATCRAIDSDFAEAHAWWAYAVVLGMVYWSTEPDEAVLDEALSATTAALAIDDHNATFHMLRGRVQLARRQYSEALTANERAITLNPSMAAAYCGLGDSLCYEGRYDEALEHFSRSVALGSHDPQRWAFLSYGSLALVFSERFEEALEWATQASSIPNCQYWTFAHAVVALGHLGRGAEATAAVEQLLERCPQFSMSFAAEKLFYLKRPEQLELYLEGLRLAGVPDQSRVD